MFITFAVVFDYSIFTKMQVIRTVDNISELCAKAKKEGKTIGLVPTMGALHAGHISLIERARKENDIVVVSVFVNPTQFNNPEDLRTYPRTEKADCEKLEAADVDYAFIPSVEEIYPEEDTRVFDLGPVADVMEGAMRPGHFNGVAQIVSRLFAMTEPTRAYFGEKDFQQIAVIRRMAQTCAFDDIDIVSCPIKREDDGLAMSSRNVRLTPHQREVAPAIHKILKESAGNVNGRSVEEVAESVVSAINAYPEMEVEYYQIVNPLTMQPISDWSEAPDGEAVGCVTVYLGDVRLIDNIKYNVK